MINTISKSIFLFACFISVNTLLATDWGNSKPLVDAVLQQYQQAKNYKTIIADEWLKSDGTTEPIGDTIYAFRYNNYGYLKNGVKEQVFTPNYDVFIDISEQRMVLHEVSAVDLKQAEKYIPTMESVFKMLSVCDSVRHTDGTNGIKILEFYQNNPLMNKTRVIVSSDGWIKEIWRYYTLPGEYVAQHTRFLEMSILTTENIPEFKETSYIKNQEGKPIPAGIYKDFELMLIKK